MTMKLIFSATITMILSAVLLIAAVSADVRVVRNVQSNVQSDVQSSIISVQSSIISPSEYAAEKSVRDSYRKDRDNLQEFCVKLERLGHFEWTGQLQSCMTYYDSWFSWYLGEDFTDYVSPYTGFIISQSMSPSAKAALEVQEICRAPLRDLLGKATNVTFVKLRSSLRLQSDVVQCVMVVRMPTVYDNNNTQVITVDYNTDNGVYNYGMGK
jgi:hypothetical protein